MNRNDESEIQKYMQIPTSPFEARPARGIAVAKARRLRWILERSICVLP